MSSTVAEKRFVWKFIDEVTSGVKRAKAEMQEAENTAKSVSEGASHAGTGWKTYGDDAKQAATKAKESLTDQKEALETFRQKAIESTKSAANSLNLYSDKLKGIPRQKVTNLEAKVKDAKLAAYSRKIHDVPKQVWSTLSVKDRATIRIKGFQDRLKRLPNAKTITLRIKDQFSNQFRRVQTQTASTKKNFEGLKSVMMGTFAGGAALNGIYAITNGIKNMAGAGMQFDTEQQKMLATWHTLTGSASAAHGMVDTINDLSIKTGQATGTVNELEQGFYHLHSSKSEADDMTKAMLNMGDAVGLSGQQLTQVEQDMVHGLATGKVTQGELNQIGMYFPMIDEKMAKHFHTTVAGMRQMASAGKITGKDLEEVFEQMGNSGKYKHAVDNMMKTTWGAFRTIGSMAPRLVGSLEDGLFKARNPLVGAIAKWTTDPATKKGFENFGKAMGRAFSTTATLVGALLKPLTAVGKAAANALKPFASGVWAGMKFVFSGMADGAKALSSVLSGVSSWAGKVLDKFNKYTGLSKIFGPASSAAKGFGMAIGGLSAPVLAVVAAVKTYNGVMNTFAAASKIASAAAKVFTASNKALSLSFMASPIFIAVAAVVALGAAFYEAYKKCKPFREFINGIGKNVAKMAKDVINWFKKIGKAIGDSFTGKAGWEKNLRKQYQKARKEAQQNAKQQAKIEEQEQRQSQKRWQKHWKTLSKGALNLWNGFKRSAKNGMNYLQKNHQKWSKQMQKSWSTHWRTVTKLAVTGWRTLTKHASSGMQSMHRDISGGLSRISSIWHSIWQSLADFFGNIWDTIKKYAQDGMNAVISVINAGIGAIDKVWSFFTGHGSGIGKLGKVHFAQGGIVHRSLSVVNDGPGDDWKELMQFPDGSFGMSQERNATLMLPVGTRVYSGPETKEIMNAAGIEHYATGGIVGAQHFANGGIVRSLENFIAGAGDAISGLGEKFRSIEQFLEAPIQKIKSVIQNAVGGNYSRMGHWGELAKGEWDKITNGMKHWVQHTLTQFLYSFESKPLSQDMMRAGATIEKVQPSDGFFSMLWQTIMSESGGRSITQQVHDVNSGGNEAAGILQYTPGTFAKYALPGHNNRFNPFDEILAFFNNTDWLNSIGSTIIRGVQKIDWLHSGPQGGRRDSYWPLLATGGEVFGTTGAIIGDNPEHHEFVINPYAPSAEPLIEKAIDASAGTQGQVSQGNTNGGSKLDQMIELLAKLVELVGDIDPELVLDMDQVTRATNKQNAKQLLRVKG